MWDVETEIEEERSRLILFDKCESSVGNQLGEILFSQENFRCPFIEIVTILSVNKEVIEIIYRFRFQSFGEQIAGF